MLGLRGDISRFGKFVTSLWGALAAISILFPILNSMFKVIPQPITEPRLATIVALVAAVFALSFSFVERHIRLGNLALHSAMARFGLAIIIFGAYMVLTPVYAEYSTNSNNIIKLGIFVLSSINVISYVAIFAFLTSAMSALAVMEYTKVETDVSQVVSPAEITQRYEPVAAVTEPDNVFQRQA